MRKQVKIDIQNKHFQRQDDAERFFQMLEHYTRSKRGVSWLRDLMIKGFLLEQMGHSLVPQQSIITNRQTAFEETTKAKTVAKVNQIHKTNAPDGRDSIGFRRKLETELEIQASNDMIGKILNL